MEAACSVRLVNWNEAKPALARVRGTVFVREQGVPEALEWDGLDDNAVHALAECADGAAIGTARLLADGHIGRMAVLVSWRSRGVGSALLDRLTLAARAHGMRTVWLHAQTHAAAFYRLHGFEVTSSEFLDAGIPHVTMTRHLDPLQVAPSAAGDDDSNS